MNDNEYNFNKFIYNVGRSHQMIAEAINCLDKITVDPDDMQAEHLELLVKLRNYLHAMNSLLGYE